MSTPLVTTVTLGNSEDIPQKNTTLTTNPKKHVAVVHKFKRFYRNKPLFKGVCVFFREKRHARFVVRLSISLRREYAPQTRLFPSSVSFRIIDDGLTANCFASSSTFIKPARLIASVKVSVFIFIVYTFL